MIIVIHQLDGKSKEGQHESCQAEFDVPWLNEILLLLTTSLFTCQRMKENITIFISDEECECVSEDTNDANPIDANEVKLEDMKEDELSLKS